MEFEESVGSVSVDAENAEEEEKEEEEEEEEEHEGVTFYQVVKTLGSCGLGCPSLVLSWSSKVDKDVKRRGGGFTKLCSLSPQRQAFIGESELARTEVVKRLWTYIR
ncbi:hypothetical protein REPUB_Repub04eG0067900 [Reevesia pubescens]